MFIYFKTHFITTNTKYHYFILRTLFIISTIKNRFFLQT